MYYNAPSSECGDGGGVGGRIRLLQMRRYRVMETRFEWLRSFSNKTTY